MLGFERSGIAFSDIPGFPFSKTTLPVRIIHLRKISQEKHVRRMKVAHQRKEIHLPIDSMCISPSISRRHSDFLREPFTTPSSAQGSGEALFPFASENSKCISSKVNRNNFSPRILCSEYRKNDSHTKFTKVKNVKNSSEIVKGDGKSDTALDLHCENVLAKNSSNKLKKLHDTARNTEQERASNVNKTRKKYKQLRDASKLPFAQFQNIGYKNTADCTLDDTEIMQNRVKMIGDSQTTDHDSRTENGNRADLQNSANVNANLKEYYAKCKNSAEMKTKCFSSSKIPVLLARLSFKETDKPSHLLLSENTLQNPISSENGMDGNPEFHIPIAGNSNEAAANRTALKRIKLLEMRKEGKISNSSFNECFMRDLKSITLRNSPEYNFSRNLIDKEEEMSSNTVSRWLSSITDTEVNSKNSNTPPLAAYQETNSTTAHKEIWNNSKKSAMSQDRSFISPSRQTYSLNDSSLGSDQSIEYYYDTETGDDAARHQDKGDMENENEWKEDSDDDDSIITIPGNERENSITPNNFVFNEYSKFPDYPKTPYNLRYPRYKAKEIDGLSKSFADNCSTKMKSPISKIRNKSFSLTPRKKKGNKAKKNQKLKK